MEGLRQKSKSPFLMDGAAYASTTNCSCRCGGDVSMELSPSYSPKRNEASKLLSQLESLIDDIIKNKGSKCDENLDFNDFNHYFIEPIDLLSEINELVIKYEISDNDFKERFKYCIDYIFTINYIKDEYKLFLRKYKYLLSVLDRCYENSYLYKNNLKKNISELIINTFDFNYLPLSMEFIRNFEVIEVKDRINFVVDYFIKKMINKLHYEFNDEEFEHYCGGIVINLLVILTENYINFFDIKCKLDKMIIDYISI